MANSDKANVIVNPHHHPAARCFSSRSSAPGFLYVAVLFTMLIVMASVTAALSISTSNLRGESDRSGRDDALRLAESEVQRLGAWMNTSTQWRVDATHGIFSDWYSPTVDGVADANSQVRYQLSDVDGDLSDDPFDSVQLTVHAKVNRSEVAVSIELETDPYPLGLLDYSVTASDDVQLISGGSLTCEQAVQVVDDCKVSGFGILTTPRLECGGRVEVTLRGDLSTANVTLPSYSVVDRYAAVGTEISLLAMPRVGGSLTIQDVVLSSSLNPYGSVDAAGIYWLDAQGSKVVISHCMLQATLAIRNASHVEISGGVVWTFPKDPDVILATDSPINFSGVEETLSEIDRHVNFNPPSTPYRQTLSNNTATDVFPSSLAGILYTSNDLHHDPRSTGAALRVTGAVIARDIDLHGSLVVTQLDEALRTPPLGLLDPVPRRFVRGTARRIASPQ